jgi:8-oxo-dGTP diphosphatase
MKRKFYITQYAAIFDSKKRLLVVRDAMRLKGLWVLPGGHINEELDPLQALKREIKEETNLDMKDAEVFSTAIKYYRAGDKGYRLVIYYKVLAKGKIKLNRENDAYLWASLKDTKNMKFRDNQERKIILDMLGEKK